MKKHEQSPILAQVSVNGGIAALGACVWQTEPWIEVFLKV
jgi:hypothetical protein